jgi:hypothetical protein
VITRIVVAKPVAGTGRRSATIAAHRRTRWESRRQCVSTAAGPVQLCWIGGRRAAGTSGVPWAVVDPATGATVATVELAGVADVDLAVTAARAVKHVMSDLTGVPRKAWHRTVFSHPGTTQRRVTPTPS